MYRTSCARGWSKDRPQMKKIKRNYTLWDKNRFKVLEKEKKLWLKNLSPKKALELEEGMLSSSLIWHWRKNFISDTPICLKESLKKKI